MRKIIIIFIAITIIPFPKVLATSTIITSDKADKIFQKAVKNTNKWMLTTPYTVTKSLTINGEKIYHDIHQKDTYNNIKIIENNITTDLIINNIIYKNSFGRILFDDLEENIATELGLKLDSAWLKKNYEETWTEIPEIYGLQEEEVADISKKSYISLSFLNENLSYYIKEDKALWYGNKNDTKNGKLKLIDNESKNQNTLSVGIKNNIITSITKTEKNEITTIKFSSYKDIIKAPVDDYLDYDLIRKDIRYQEKRTKYLAEIYINSIYSYAQFLAAFSLRQPDPTDYIQATKEILGEKIKTNFYDNAIEIIITYGGNDYTYCSPIGNSSISEVLILSGSCEVAGYKKLII